MAINRLILAYGNSTGMEVFNNLYRPVDVSQPVSTAWEVVTAGSILDRFESLRLHVRPLSSLTNQMYSRSVNSSSGFLHPGILDGITHNRNDRRGGSWPVDMVAVGLPEISDGTCVQSLDLVAAALITAAARNHEHVIIVIEPADYRLVVGWLMGDGEINPIERRRFAAKALDRLATCLHLAAEEARNA